ncbi:hypothetical protein [Flavobacterium sp.]|uniref:hypothetical protein n=1 Tax=Flavobacterium sp. TaxID=239 RepID=UPI0037BEC85E
MNKITTLLLIFLSLIYSRSFAQKDIDNILKGGEIIVNGLSFLKSNNSDVKQSYSKVVENVCIKNKLSDKITFVLTGKDEEDDVVKKELVIQKDGNECVFELPKGIYTYEVILSNKEIFKKGEYKFIEDITITVKQD